MTKDDIKGFLFSLAWCTWSNHHAERVLGVLKRGAIVLGVVAGLIGLGIIYYQPAWFVWLKE